MSGQGAGSRGSWERVKEGPSPERVVEGYTPTTVQVRDAYTRAMRNAFIASAGEHDAEFDRWLASERARIWDEGAKAQADAYGMTVDAGVNPYRKGGDA